ncbi:glycosyltransferase [Evansella sp. AB-rgal1]|uniref:glycosyltransferase n=1 Tax=Evansella sp. AB-rgal1 TaxID=3242696 RepID=UPI00359CFD8A
MKKPTIVIVHPHLNVGGAEKMIAFVANNLSSQYKVHLALIKNTKISLELSPDITIHTFGLNEGQAIRKMSIVKAWIYTRSIKRQIASLCKGVNADIALAFDDRISLLTWWALRKMPCITLFSQRADPYNKTKLWKIVTSFLYRHCDGIVFQTEMAKRFYDLPEKKHTSIIPNPAIERSSFNRDKQKMFLPSHYIVSAGRFQFRKGFDVLIKAFKIVSNKYPEYRLLIYGEGDERENLLNLINEYELEHVVDLPGSVLNVMDRCRGAEMFVLPSRSEGIPNVLIEAMVNGLPCIATDCTPGGARLMLNDGECGLLVPIDDEQELAEAIINYIKKPELRTSKINNAFVWLEQFNEDDIKHKWLSFVNGLLPLKEEVVESRKGK